MSALLEVMNTGRYVDHISPNDLSELPVGLNHKFGSTDVTIAVSKARFTVSFTELTVFCKVKLPQIDKTTGRNYEIFFGADNIKLSHDGGIIGDAQLVLLGDFNIPFNGGNLLLTLKGGNDMRYSANNLYNTYAKFECKGIEEIGLAADVLFPKNLLVPVNDDNIADTVSDNRVRGSFKTVVTDWSDIIAEFSMQPFAIRGLEKFPIVVKDAIFDFSDVKNSSQVRFPTAYENLVPGNEALWKGVYVSQLEISLPKEFQKEGNNRPITFSAENMLIDNMGISGNFEATNILDRGSASGWAFSVDRFSLNIRTNRLIAAGFEGYIALPISKQSETGSLKPSSSFAYQAIISEGNQYLMRVITKSDLNFDIWQAKARITPDSYIELFVKDDQFRPRAVLNGSMGIEVKRENNSDTEGKPIATIKGLEFQQLVLQTEAPFLQVKYFGYKDSAKISNFPIVLFDVGLSIQSKNVALSFGIKVNIMENKISAASKMDIIGEIINEGQGVQFQYKALRINDLIVKANFDKFKLDGFVRFNRNHPIMGTGFEGALDLEVGLATKAVKVNAKAAFGSKPLQAGDTEIFRYWYVDAMATGFTIPIGIFNIIGLGGGASYHMERSATMVVADSICPTAIGFIPNPDMGLGFRARVGFSVAAKQLCKGEIGLEMMFTSSGGLANIGFFGKAFILPSDELSQKYVGEKLMSSLKSNLKEFSTLVKGKENAFKNNILNGKFDNLANSFSLGEDDIAAEGAIGALVGINYDFLNQTLHSTFDLYVNIAGGIIKGRASKGRAGWAVMHFAPDDWYIYMGTPTDRLGLKIGIGSISIEAGGYFVTGKQIPDAPPPPAIVADILGVSLEELDYMRELNTLNDGAGFAFGADISINTGDLRFLMFYASFQAGLGFDIMLKDYGDAQCKGRSGPIGMNGWYASGQSYVYLQGELGIRVKIFKINKNIPIIKAGAAVLMQAMLPNPAWFRGYVGGYFSVLGGLVKGNFRFKVVIGEKCELVDGGNPINGIAIISDMTPTDKNTNVDVFAIPQAVFNMPVDKEFDMSDDTGDKTYRIKLGQYTLSTKGGKAISGKLTWNQGKTSVMFESAEILPPNTEILAKVVVEFEEKKAGQWTLVYENNQKITEEKQISFVTGTAPKSIPLTNIEYSYPAVEQKYFFPKEYDKGFVQLKRGQAYLFSDKSYKQTLNVISKDQLIHTLSFVYDSSNKRIDLNLPQLAIETLYSFNFTGIKQAGAIDNITQQTENITADSSNIEIASNKAAGTMAAAQNLSFLAYNFATSMYNTFSEKMNDKTQNKTIQATPDSLSSSIKVLYANVAPSEGFSIEDLTGVSTTANQPMVQPIIVPIDEWFVSDINPLIYRPYPHVPSLNFQRDTTINGTPPVRNGAEINAAYYGRLLANVNDQYIKSKLPHLYSVSIAYYNDFIDLQNKLVNMYVNNLASPAFQSPFVTKMIGSTFPELKPGLYTLQYNYMLPGGLITSKVNFIFNNKENQLK
ncbi:hypothetical protein [Niabella ginsengisoli]|uniref:Uncharacterized protein n=1 Tax=Niabella ginsengisoli TaxID=522298 RepID=A0ABS9SHY5_9BACT|nr:hypothetical protein [Niabella ginsengisoli]MCH5597983.1 hypothetical protein [Niabella ginsengisoli]